MKIACKSCGARYSVADEKIGGRAFKIRCPRCGVVIVTRATAAPRWYLALDGVEAGPLTTAELSRTIIEGDTGPATPVWREGLGDWISLSQLAEFAHLLVQPQAEGGRDLFGPPSGAPEVATQPYARPPEAPLLVGSRNESSVLFSIGNLQALVGGCAVASPAPDQGSGLIDIRSMAQGLDADPPGDLPALGQPAAPVLLPSTSAASTPRWLFPLLATMGAALASVVVALVLTLTPVAAADEPPPAPAEPNTEPKLETNEYIDTDEVMVEVKALKAPTAKVPRAIPNTTKAEPRPRKRPAVRTSSRPKSVAVRPSTTRRPRPKPTGKQPQGSGKKTCDPSDLGCLIDEATNKKSAVSAKVAQKQPAPGLSPSLTSREVQRGMRKIKGAVQGCFDRFQVPGWAKLRVTIGSNGRVSSTRLQGIFAGTPTGACLKNAVSRARFPRFANPSLSIEYPFHLREG